MKIIIENEKELKIEIMYQLRDHIIDLCKLLADDLLKVSFDTGFNKFEEKK